MQPPAFPNLQQFRPDVVAHSQQPSLVGSRRQHHQIPAAANELIGKLRRLHSAHQRLLELGQDPQPVPLGQCPHHLHQSTVGGGPQQPVDVGDHHLGPAKRQQLVEQRLTVAHRTGGPAGHQVDCRRLDLDPLRLGNLGQSLPDAMRFDRAEIEPLAAGENGVGQLLRIGGAEDELDVGRGLFEGLEEGVERLLREHVHFVDDVDLVLRAHRADVHIRPQRADLIDAAVRRPVDLDHIDIAPLGNPATDLAGVAGVAPLGRGTVERLRQDAGGRGLANSPGPGEEVGVGDASSGDGIAQRLGNGFLSHHFAKRLRSKPPGHHCVFHLSLRTSGMPSAPSLAWSPRARCLPVRTQS